MDGDAALGLIKAKDAPTRPKRVPMDRALGILSCGRCDARGRFGR